MKDINGVELDVGSNVVWASNAAWPHPRAGYVLSTNEAAGTVTVRALQPRQAYKATATLPASRVMVTVPIPVIYAPAPTEQ